MSAAALTNNAGSSSGSFPPPIKKQAPPSFKSTSGLLDAAGDGGTAGSGTAAFGGALPLPLPLAASGQQQHGTAGAAATGGTNTSPSWQHPYVCVFKKFAQLLTKQGDCVEDLDNVISKRVFKIQGAISANNYVQVPKQGAKAPAKSLGLTGEFIYVQLRTLGGKFFNVHLDFAVADRNILERITLTNMQSEPKAQSRVILYPCHLPNDEWATVCLRVPQVLKLFSRSMPHAHVLKAVQVCASCVVRNVYTSDLRFQSHAELPREMKLTQKESSGELVSNWLNIPESVDAELKVSEPAPPPPAAAAAASGNGQVRQDRTSRPPPPAAFRDRTAAPAPLLDSTLPAMESTIVAPNDQSVTGVGAIQPAKILADPLIEVNRLLGVSSGAKNLAFWLGEDRIVFASSTALVVMAASSDPDDKPPPLFLFGHSRPIGLLQTSAAGDWVASVQQAGGGDGPSIRLWHAPAQSAGATSSSSSPRCHTILSCPSLLHVKSVAFDHLSKYVAIAGLDTQRRQQIFVWDIAKVPRGGNAKLYARQMSDWDLNAIKFSPFEDLKIVSCGKENIRFWRVKDAHLPGQSVTLNSLARGTMFNDLCFEANKNTNAAFLGDSSLGYKHKIFVATAAGEVCVVSYRDRSVLMLHKLHQSPITTIAATESFCVTAAEDKYIRVCPLDFQSFFLHCMHEAVPQGVDLTAGDGLKVLSYTADGTIGQLDMQTQGFDVIHRAHASRIVDGAVSVLYEELVTVTEDGFIKIWSINTMRQHTEFFSGNDAPCCVGCHPKRHLIAVGFRSGTLRLFDVDGPQVIGEFVNFKFPVVSLAFAQTEEQDKSLIVACDSKGAMVLYEEANNFAPSRNPDLFAGLQEPPPQNCPLFVLADSHRLLLKYYDARTLALFTFQDLEFQRKFNLRAASVSHYSFSFDSTKVLVGCSDAKLKIFSVKGPLLHDIPLVAGPVTAAALVTLESPKPDPFQTPDCLLFTASEQDSLIKASLLRSGTKAFTAHREEEQCFLGHAFAPYKLLVTPNKLIGVSGSEVITWDVKGSYFEEVYYNSHVRQDALPAEEVHAGEGAEQTLLNGTENGSREPDFLINTNGQNVTNLDQIAENSFTRGLGGRGSSSASGSARKNGRDTDKQGFTPTPGLFVADQKSKSPSQGATARATPPAFMFYPNTSPGDSLGSSTMFIESGIPQSYSSISPIKKKMARGGNKTGEPTTAADQVNASVATILKQSTEQESLLPAKKTSFVEQGHSSSRIGATSESFTAKPGAQQLLGEKTPPSSLRSAVRAASAEKKSVNISLPDPTPASPSTPPTSTAALQHASKSPNLSLIVEANLQSAQKVKAPPNSTVKAHGRLAELQEMQHRKDLQDAVEQAGKALQFDDGISAAEDPKTISKNFVQGGSSSSASASVKLAGGAAGDAVSQPSRMSDVDDLSATCVLQKSGLGLEVQFDGGPEDAAAAEVAGEQCTVIDEQTGAVKNAAKKKFSGPAVSTVIGSGTPFSWEPRYLVTGVGDWISVEPNASEHGVNFVEKSVIPLNNRQVHAIDTQDNMLAVLCDGLVLVYELWIPPAQGGQNGGGNVSIASKGGSNGTGGKTKPGSAGKNKVASSKFEFGPDARGEAGTSNPGSPSTDESAADEEANTHKLIASYSLGNAGLQGAIVKFLNAETLIVITRREHPDTVNADESKVSIIDDTGSDIKASIAAASPKDAVDGPLPPQPAHSQTKTSVSVESRIDALRLPRGSKSAVAVPVRLQHSWEEIEGAIASSAPLEFVTSALVSSSPTGCAIAPLDEFITMAPQSLMFWRLCPDNAVLQFQQAHKPAWICSPGHTFSALSFAYVKPELSRVLVGTSRGVLLTYDFEENLPINEMPLPQGNAGAINFIDAPAYPMVLCGVGATVGKYVVDEAGHKVMPVPRGYVESDVKSVQQNKALVDKPVHLDGVVHKCATQDRSGRSMMATSTSLWYVNWRTNVKLRLHSFHAFPSNTMECHPEKNLLATCADDGLVRLWSYKERPSRSLTGLAQFSGASPCLSLTFLSSRILFCGFQDGCVRLLDLENLTSIGRVEVEQTGLVLVEALGPQTAVAATKEGKVVQIMIRLSSSREVIDARRAELKPENDAGPVSCGHVMGDSFLMAFANHEVWIWQSERKRKPVLDQVWVLPKPALGSRGSSSMLGVGVHDSLTNLKTQQYREKAERMGLAVKDPSLPEACFVNEKTIAAMVRNLVYVYDVRSRTVLNRMALGHDVECVRMMPTPGGSRVETAAAGLATAGGNAKSAPLPEAWAFHVLTKEGRIGKVEFWDNFSVGEYHEKVPHAGPGVPTDLRFLNDRPVVKTNCGICVWDPLD